MSVFQPDSRTQTALQRFVTLLMEANQVMNLTACKSGAELWERHVLDSFVKVGMKVQWKGLRDKATNTVLTSQIEIN